MWKTSEQLYACNYVLWRIMSLHWSGQNEAIICKSELISPANRILCVQKLFPALYPPSLLPLSSAAFRKFSRLPILSISNSYSKLPLCLLPLHLSVSPSTRPFSSLIVRFHSHHVVEEHMHFFFVFLQKGEG